MQSLATSASHIHGTNYWPPPIGKMADLGMQNLHRGFWYLIILAKHSTREDCLAAKLSGADLAKTFGFSGAEVAKTFGEHRQPARPI